MIKSSLTLTEQVFPGDSEMARLMRAKDWSQTPLGPVENWPQSLRMMVNFLLANRFPLLLWWGPEFCQIYNDPYRPVLGAKHSQSIGQPASECWAEIWDIIGPLIETPFNGGSATWMDDLFLEINRHGFVEETHFTVAYSPVPDDTASHGIGGVLATVHEITEQVVGARRLELLGELGSRSAEAKTADEACQIAAATLGRHTKDVPFALLYLLDPAGEEARLSATMGIAAGEDARPPVIALQPADGASQIWPLAEAVRAGSMQVVSDLAERCATVPQGPWDDAPQSAVVIPIRSNIPQRLAGVLVAGISARLRLDDAYAGFLELVAGQIATTIANARAYEAERKRAEELAAIDRAKTTFFSNVSHEFRTPLTLMLGPLGDVLSGMEDLSPAARQELVVAQRNSLRLLKLVNTLLDFSRIEAGRVQAQYVATDLAALTTDLASAFRSLMDKAGLGYQVDCPPLPEPAFVDRDMWEKIVLNLLSNAFKFTLAGSISIQLRAQDGVAELRVRDTGTGIPAEEAPRIFERFHRVEGARARTHEGSGIGLALVQELVQLQGGAIAAESVQGQGTTFTVRIPLGQRHLSAEQISAAPTLASTALGANAFLEEAERWLPDAPREPGTASHEAPALHAPLHIAQGARVLVVDDNADMRDYLARLLSEQYTVRTVANGAEALGAIAADPPDLVLADVMMPELDGFGMLQRLRSDPRTAALPVILLSARAGEEAAIEGLAQGADDYLVKPFSAREVLSHVAARLEIARTRQDADLRTRAALDAVMQLAEVMASAPERQEASAGVATTLAALARDVLGCEIVSLMSIGEDEHLAPLATVGRTPENQADWEGDIANYRIADYYDTADYARLCAGEPVVVNVPGNLTRGIPAYGTRTTLTVALRGGETMIGLLSCAYHTTDHTYTQTEFDLAFGFAQLATVILERARLVQERAAAQAEVIALQEATRRMDEFLSVASHELRTPLTSVTANVQLSERFSADIKTTALPEAQQRRVEKLHLMLERSGRQLLRLDRLVGDLLDVSRITAGKLEMRREPSDLIAIIQDAIEAQRAAWPERSITRDLPKRRLAPIQADADRIGQVVTNYLTNALKYAPPEKPIAVSLRVGDGQVRVAVRDHGPGLTAAQQGRLFERFYRVPGIGQQSGSGMGLGLGLYICKTIIERHGGALGVESEPGQGATFWFTLPIAD